MRAIRLEGVGQLALREVAKPVPGAGEILVRVEACGICGTDRHLFHGEFPSSPPVTLGHEFAGTVEAVGPGVATFAPGMTVTGDPNIACGRCPECHRGRVNLCRNLQAIGIHRDGGFADYVVMPETQAHRLPDGLDPVHGAFAEPLACCIHGMDIAALRPGETVVVLGGGLIGLLVVQLARQAGAGRVVLVTRSAEKRALAETLGATDTVDPRPVRWRTSWPAPMACCRAAPTSWSRRPACPRRWSRPRAWPRAAAGCCSSACCRRG